MVRTFFWLLIYVTLLALLVNFYLLEILEIVIVLLVFDLVMLIVTVYHNEEDQLDSVESYISMKLDGIERTSEQILKKVFTPETQERLMKEEKEIVKWLENF